jgi:hypothetical protein
MPSKYSHSVVLAQQTSSGIISLPDDQYIDYLKSSPLITTRQPPQRVFGPPKIPPRVVSARINGSERIAVQSSLRHQTSSDQLPGSTHRQEASNDRSYGTAKREIVDYAEGDDDRFDGANRFSQPSNVATPARSSEPNLRKNRPSRRPPGELYQQVAQNSLLSPTQQNSQRVLKKATPQAVAQPEARRRSPVELPKQVLAFSGVLHARSDVSETPGHARDESNSKSLAPTQLSRTSTERTSQEDSPATTLSDVPGTTTPIADGQRPSLSRNDSALSQHTRIFPSPPSKMPLQADFDGFSDDLDIGDGESEHISEPAEPEEARKLRLINMRAYHAMETAINDSPARETFDLDKNRPNVPNGNPVMQSPSQKRQQDHLDSLRSLSDSSDLSIGRVSVSQGKGTPRPSTTASKPQSPKPASRSAPALGPAPAPGLAASPQQNRLEASSSTTRKQTPNPSIASRARSPTPHPPTTNNVSLFPPIPPVPPIPANTHLETLKRQIERTTNLPPIDPSASSLTISQFLSDLESRFREPGDPPAMSPPDITRHPLLQIGGTVNDGKQSSLTFDSSATISSNKAATGQQGQDEQGQQQRQRSKSLFASLRFKGKKR